MTAETQRPKTDSPVIIAASKKGYSAATHYPNHYKESGAFIASKVPAMLEVAGKAVIEHVPTGTPPGETQMCDVWKRAIAGEIVNDIQKKVLLEYPELESDLDHLISLAGSDYGFVESLGLMGKKPKKLGPHSSRDWVPKEWQPIIVEGGILRLTPKILCDVTKLIYEIPERPISLGSLQICFDDKQPKYGNDYHKEHAHIHCRGRYQAQHIMFTSSLNYALKLQSIDHHISSVDDEGTRRPRQEVEQEYIASTS